MRTIRAKKGLDKTYICRLCFLALGKVVTLHKKLEDVKKDIKEAERSVILKISQLLHMAAFCLSFNVSTLSSVIAKCTAHSTVSIFTLGVGLDRANGCVFVYIQRHN